jgi:hypothetical protein
LGWKIVDVDRLGVAGWLPTTAAIFQGSDQFFLFRVHTDHRVMVAHEAPDLLVEIAKLRVAMGMLGALDRLPIRLQRVSQFS